MGNNQFDFESDQNLHRDTPAQPRDHDREDGRGLWSLILAIVGAFLPFFGIIAEIVAISLANGALRANRKDGLAKAGKIVAWVVTLLWVLPMSVGLLFCLGVSGVSMLGSTVTPRHQVDNDPAVNWPVNDGGGNGAMRRPVTVKCAKCKQPFEAHLGLGEREAMVNCPHCGAANRITVKR